jgi:hypothetical protein
MQGSIPQPFAVPPGSGRVLKLIGVTHKLISQQTGSNSSMSSILPCRAGTWTTQSPGRSLERME